MASGTLPPPVAPPRSRSARSTAAPSDFIDEQIGKTRAYVKSVDIAHGLLVLATGLIAYLLAMAMVDHWLVPGGLGTWGRVLAFLVVVGSSAWHLVRTVVPLVILKINPLYAANTIEQCQPSFKNSLLSVLQLRQQRAEVPSAVFDSVERHAAARLADVTVESTVDRSALIRIGYVMLGVVIAAALYYLVSPKDALQTAGRVLMPWADIAAPTRVTVADVQPGDVSVIRGQQVQVSAEVTGLREDEVARVVYSSDDGQIVDRELPMYVGAGGYRHVVRLPPGDERLQGSVTYRVEAGDARSASFQITVEPTPMIDVESVHYDYPEYTAPILQDKRVEGVGDIRAVEGTVVTIRARANQTISRAAIDFGCDGKTDATMKVSGDRAIGTFVLRFADRTNLVPEHTNYQLTFYNRQGVGNPEPVQHAIEVLPDLAPEVSLERPAEPLVEVPEDEAVEFRATARDADFKLSEVLLRHEGRAGLREPESLPLLAAEKAPWQGKFDAQTRKSPRELGYRAGDEIRYWIEAVDNKTPIDTANRASTRPGAIRVLAPLRPQEKPKNDRNAEDKPQDEEQPKDAEASGEKKNDGEKDADSKDEPQEGENEKPKDDGANEENPEKGEQEADTPGEEGAKGDKGEAEKEQEGGMTGGNEGEKGENPEQKPQPGAGEDGQAANDGEGNAEQRPADGSKGEAAGKQGTKPDGTSGKPGGADDPANQPPERKGPAPDADAIEELLKDRQKKQGGEAVDKTGNSPQPNDGMNPGDNATGAKTDQAPSGEQDPAGAKPEDKDATGSKPDEKKPEDPMGEGGPQKEDQPQESGSAEKDATLNDGMGDQSRNGQSDNQGKPGGNAPPEATEEKPEGEQGEKPSPGPGLGDRGPGNTGRPDKSKTGAPEKHDHNIPQHKESNQDDDNAKPSDEGAKSPSITKKRSENPTKGEERGDRSGDGASGGGDSAKQPGKDSDGSSQESETGKGAAKTPGEGETGDNPGENVEAEGETGNSKDERGNGSAGKPKDMGEKKPGEKGSAGDGEAAGSDDAAQEAPNPTGRPGNNPGKGTVNPGGGKATGDAQDAAAPPPTGAEKEDPADLEYAKKATDLALEHLRDRMKQGDDQEILDRLKWTREDAERFLANWDQIKREAGTNSAAAEKRLNEELKSLGLRRGSAQFTEGQATKDAERGLKEGVNVPTPAEFQDRQRAYRVGTGRK